MKRKKATKERQDTIASDKEQSDPIPQFRPGATHVGVPQTFQALGQTWNTVRLERDIWFEFVKFAKTMLPNPITVGSELCNSLLQTDATKDQRNGITDTALLLAMDFMGVQSGQVISFLSSMEGSSYLLYLILKPNHPEMTPKLAWDISWARGTAYLQELFDVAQGLVQKKEESALAV